jgi:[methyl-Co(III) methanol-specific corrinoid protein]:coenzyme M methyltransferase
MNPRQIMRENLAGRPTERPSVLCPGGMMSMAVTEVMTAVDAPWPAAHSDPAMMVRLALAMQEATGFDNVALPFCMTIEAEAYGARVEMGSVRHQPKVRGFLLGPDGQADLPEPDFRAGRAGVFLDALSDIRDRRPGLGVIGNVVGPFSLLGMLADPLQVLRWTRRRPEALGGYLRDLTHALATFARMQADAGVDAICIAEPTATGEILGGELFRKFALPHLSELCRRVSETSVGVIVHICGRVGSILPELEEIEVDAVSFDSMVNLVHLRAKGPPWQVMGNVDAFVLAAGPPGRIGRYCARLLDGGVQLLAPACGVVPTTPAAHLRAMGRSVRPEDTQDS